MIYRIRSQNLDGTYIYHIERKIKFLFFSFWKREKISGLFHTQEAAEKYLPHFIFQKENATKIKYYHIVEDKIISGNSESEALKRSKLKAFL